MNQNISQRLGFLLVMGICMVASVVMNGQDPVLFSVNNEAVHKSEFEYIYEKNNGKEADYSKESIDEYLDLYIKFKLKVAKAKQLKMDTIPSLLQELEGYRKQLATNYLVDKELIDKLIDEAYQRKKKDLKVSHLLVSVLEDASEKAEGNASEKIWRIQEKAHQGADFGLLAHTLSEDKASSQNNGKLGWMTAMLPNGFYEFENVMYNTPVGKVSKPVRTTLGYHLIKVEEERPAYGEMEVAHILIRNKRKGQIVENAREVADSIYQALQGGANFELMARDHSDDKNTSNKGGYLGFFGIGQYEKTFESSAFQLKNDGDYTRPIISSIGYHIIRRISKKDMADEEKYKRGLSSAVQKSDRYEIAKDKMIKEIQKEANFKSYPDVYSKLAASLDEKFYSYRWEIPSLTKEVLCSFGPNHVYTNQDFANYCRKNTRQRLRFDKNQPVENALNQMYSQFVKEKTMQYQEANLEEKYPEFKTLMREYKEGILLFEATKVNVWDKASMDTVGLQKYYDSNRDQYTWNERGVINKYTIATMDNGILDELKKAIKTKKKEEILDQFNSEIQILRIDQSKHEKGSKELLGLDWEVGSVSNPKVDSSKKSTEIKRLQAIIPAGRKTITEARGYVIADYQEELERKWVNELKKEFSISKNEKVIQSLYK